MAENLGQVNEIMPTSWGGHSNRIAATDVITGEHSEHQKHQKLGWRKFLSYVGPGFLVSMAYLDPSSLETDMQAGSKHRFELLWIILIGMIFALIIQSLAANLGVSTGAMAYLMTAGKHLSELCKAEYPKYVMLCLWVLAELAVIGADIPAVIGTAFALNILFHIPVWVGVLCTGCSTLLLIGLQKYGNRKLELPIAVLVFIVATCFFGELSYVKPPAKDVLKGMFIPKFSGHSAAGDAIALVGGALVMPHNLYLHSALVLSRKVPNTVRGINDACRYFLIESGFALFVAFLINVAVISVSGAVCTAPNISQQNADRCGDLTLNSASFLLQNVLGKSSSTLYGIALLASGQSSTITGTYAGQYIMQGFLDLRMRKWVRNLVTRCIAIAPSLVVSIVGGPAGAGRLIIIASMILSFELPFALIPLLKFSSSARKMGPHTNSKYIIIFSWICVLGIIGINVYYLSTAFVHWLLHNDLPKLGNVFIGLFVFPFMGLYTLSIIYLTFRKDTVATYIETIKNDVVHVETGDLHISATNEMNRLPYREDLADIPLPNNSFI